MNAELLAPDHPVAGDILVRGKPDEEEEDEENGNDKDKDKQDEGDDEENGGYSE